MSIQSMLCETEMGTMAIPVASIDQVSDFSCAPPPPLSEPWVGGLAWENNRAYLVIRVGNKRMNAPRLKVIKGVRLTEKGSAFQCIVEVTKTGIIKSVHASGQKMSDVNVPSDWLIPAVAEGGSTCLFLNSDALLRRTATASPSVNGD